NEIIFKQLVEKVISGPVPEIEMPDQNAALVLKNILERNRSGNAFDRKQLIFPYWSQVAASLLFIVGTGYWLFNSTSAKSVEVPVAHSSVPHKSEGAVLSMSDGKTIVLDESRASTLQLGAVSISKSGTLLVFKKEDSIATANPVVYNTLSTPAGSQYQVVLPDGSEIWLNAGSSIRFPSKFDGSERLVSLTGEAYFEVAKNKERPFRVTSGNMTVNVLGTHFNVNAYGENGLIRTSLLEGSVKIIRGGTSNILKPGQQAVLDDLHEGIETNNANMQQVLAWKNGLFQFEGADIRTIMGEISRWYDVQVVYVGNVPSRSFEGKISRSSQLSEVLEILELSDVKFSVKGSKITVGH
ncbi:MAG: FecR domain-containing protein, partial [Flavitalea sp.]